MADYTAWLIEINEPVSGPLYFQFQHDNDWTLDHDQACHFSRKLDAQNVIDHFGWTCANAVEHMWTQLTARDIIARRRPPTDAAAFSVATSHLEKMQMKIKRKPR